MCTKFMIFCEYSVKYPRAANPPTGRDPEPSWQVGFGGKPPAANPPARRASDPSQWVGFGGERSHTSPTGQEGYLPPRGVALMHGGQRPITPQSKTNSLLPPSHSMFLTEVTSMPLGSESPPPGEWRCLHSPPRGDKFTPRW